VFYGRHIGYMGDGFYRSKDPTNSIRVLKEHTVHRQMKHTISGHIKTKHRANANPLFYTNMVSILPIWSLSLRRSYNRNIASNPDAIWRVISLI